MSDAPTPSPAPNPAPPEPRSDFHIGDEFGTAKRNLPPAGIVVICIVAIALILGIYAILERQKPQGAGSIDFVSVVDVPEQNRVLVALTLTLRNSGSKPLWIHTLKAQLKTADDKSFEDEAASAVDFDRYFEGFPALKQNAEAALSPEAKILPGAAQKGTVIVSFPVTKDVFNQRKSIALNIQPYDQALPIILTK